MKNKAVFLDRDGTIIKIKYYPETDSFDTVNKPDDIDFSPDILEVLKHLKSLGYLLILVSNQPRIGLNKLTKEEFEEIRKKFEAELTKGGVRLDRQYYCFHHPFADVSEYRQDCQCRKPGIKFFQDAAKEFDIDLTSSWTVGDGVSDILAGYNAGTKTIMIANILEAGYLALIEKQLGKVKPDYFVKKPKEILDIIKK